jgi:hypothetical protein
MPIRFIGFERVLSIARPRLQANILQVFSKTLRAVVDPGQEAGRDRVSLMGASLRAHGDIHAHLLRAAAPEIGAPPAVRPTHQVIGGAVQIQRVIDL